MTMWRLVVTGLWVCAVTAGAGYAVAFWTARGYSQPPKPEYLEGVEYQKTKVINVPILADGAVQGYVVAQFVFTVDARTHRQLSVPPETFVVDEAFRRIYGDEEVDFADLSRVDLKEMTAAIKARVNERLQAEVVQDVLIEDFHYVDKADLRH